jgi:GTPase SAR1 family protein
MNISILILGDSGTGKSSSIRTLPSKETFILNVVSKPLPFRGSVKNYNRLSPDGMTGNYYCSDDANSIKRVINLVNNKRPEIKYLIIDDLGYVAMNGFMKRALIKGYDRFSEIASEFNTAMEMINLLRDDLFCIATMHIETDKQGKTKPKTIGNMVDQYINIEGKFSYTFHTINKDGPYKFLTNNDGIHMAKTPMGCFENMYIDNDLLMIVNRINEYNNEDAI